MRNAEKRCFGEGTTKGSAALRDAETEKLYIQGKLQSRGTTRNEEPE